MNFYISALIPFITFTALFYVNWNRVDKIVDEGKFARLLFYGLLMGIVYVVLFIYSWYSIYRFEDLMLFSLMLLLPLLASGSQLSILNNEKYRDRKDLVPLSTSLGGAYSLPVSFIIASVTAPSIYNYIFIAIITIYSFFINIMGAAVLATGVQRGRLMLYYNGAFLLQIMFSSSIFLEYLIGENALYVAVPEIVVTLLLYIKIFHGRIVVVKE